MCVCVCVCVCRDGRVWYMYVSIGCRIRTWELLDLYTYIRKSKQGYTTNVNISFSMENEKRAAQVIFELTTYCL